MAVGCYRVRVGVKIFYVIRSTEVQENRSIEWRPLPLPLALPFKTRWGQVIK
jgi:hypothetical protein